MSTRACVSATFRLAVTVQYAEALDAIYHIGPVCFWAYAEMTCGFVVVCVPCVPKILTETGVWRKMKKGLGMSVTTAKQSQTDASNTPRSKNMRSANKSYLEIEDDIELDGLKTESTEHLRQPYVTSSDKDIVCTTQVTVTQDLNRSDSTETGYDHQKRWR